MGLFSKSPEEKERGKQRKLDRLARLKFLLIGLFSIFVLGTAVFVFVVPNEYNLSGNIVDEGGEGVEGVAIKSETAEATTDASGAYSLQSLKRGEAVSIVVSEDYKEPTFNLDYEDATRIGFKNFKLEGNLTLQQSVVGFVKELLTNEKYKRHNLIWVCLDEPSKEVYGSVDAYEGFFKAGLMLYSEKALRDFKVDKERITIRDAWTSPQGIAYEDVYDVPVERTLNDGTTESITLYVFEIEGKRRVATNYTKATYEETRNMLEELGQL